MKGVCLKRTVGNVMFLIVKDKLGQGNQIIWGK